MKDYGLDRGLIQQRDDEPRTNRGQNKGFWGFRKMFRDYLTKLNVAFYDACCPEASSDGASPVRYDGSIEYFDGNGWQAINLNQLNNATLTGATSVDGRIQSSSFQTKIVPFIPSSNAEPQIIPAGTGGPINLTRYTTYISTDAGGDTFTLANSDQVGQLKRIEMLVDGGGNGVVTPSTTTFITNITFANAGEYVLLAWGQSGAWFVLEDPAGIVNYT